MRSLLSYNKKLTVYLFFSAFLLIGVFIFRDYGISIDEDNTRVVGFLSLEYVFKIFAPEYIPDLNKIISGDKLAHPNLDMVPSTGSTFDLPMAFLEFLFKIEDSREYFLLRHLSTFLIFFISVCFFFQIIKQRYNSWMIGILGAAFLILSPRIFANSFYNSKDMIFMSLFVINLYVAINFLEKQNFKSAIIFSAVSGLIINARIFGLFFPPLVFLIYLINIFRKGNNKKKIIKPFLICLILIPVFIFLFWPYLWVSPLENLLHTLKELSAHELHIYTFYLGEHVFTSIPPWHYHLNWMLITTPLLYSILFIVGFVFIIQRTIRRLLKIEKNDSYTDLWRGKKELWDIIFLLTFLIPVLFAIDSGSLSYDGWRHLYFVYPSFLLISLSGLNFIKTIYFRKKSKYLYFSCFILVIPIALWMYKNHPHQNVYFNFLASKNFNERYEMDYFGLSNKQALEHIISRENKIVKIYNLSTSDLGLSRKILKKELREKINITGNIKNADYVINNYRDWRGKIKPTNFKTPSGFKIFYEIKVDNVSINTVYNKE